jgi:hypothetical protein
MNPAFKDCNTVFPNAACIAALLDRLTHHADITLKLRFVSRKRAKGNRMFADPDASLDPVLFVAPLPQSPPKGPWGRASPQNGKV